MTDIRIRELKGSTKYRAGYFQERQRSSIDIYPEAKARSGLEPFRAWNFVAEGDSSQVTGIFVEIHTTDGITG